MYKVMLVDDAEQIRMGIKLKVDWNRHGFEVCAEAGNGREALEILGRTEIDLVITDIRMPVMNGLDLLRKCRAANPKTRFVVLSGYDDFPYVRSAMQTGALDYLLKPVSSDELEDLLRRVNAELDEVLLRQQRETEKKQDSEELLRERFILQLAKEGTCDSRATACRSAELGLQTWIGETMRTCVVTIEMRIPEGRLGETGSRPDLMRAAFQLMCREAARAYGYSAEAFFDPNRPSMIHFLFALGEAPAVSAKPEEFGNCLQSEIARCLHLETVIGIGHPVDDPVELKKGYETALLAWSRSEWSKVSQIVRSEGHHENRDVPQQLEKKLEKALEKGEPVLLEEAVTDWLELAGGCSAYSYYICITKLILSFDSAIRKYNLEESQLTEQLWSINESLWKCDSNTDLGERLRETGRLILGSVRKSKATGGEEIVLSVCKYLEENYGEELSLSRLSEKYYINTAYLSDLFRRQTGKTYSQYLFEVRMKRASELLEDDDLRVFDIAALVGFPNTGYFCTVFKRQFGLSPAEYRDTKKNLNTGAKTPSFPPYS